MTDCIFCKIIAGKIPCTKIYEDSNTFVLLDANPTSLGHILVIPKKHSETLDKMEEKDLQNTIKTVHKIAKIINSFSEGYNIIQNNKKIAGQMVPHVHFHIVPRSKGDKIGWNRPSPKFSEKEIKDIANKITRLLK